MKKLIFSSWIITFIIIFNSLCTAQTGIITTIAGNGSSGYSGDGGPATAAQIATDGVAVDNKGNVYIADGNFAVRKVDPSGTITTFAGGLSGYGGDGGPATAAKLNGPYDVIADNLGNIYISDQSNNRIRKVDASGIITTIAGNGSSGYSGDGGPATLAQMNYPQGITLDFSGNLYIADRNNNCIRKINTSGIITTVAGNGTLGFSGDGGAATSAQLNNPYAVPIDGYGNMYILDGNNNRVRKVNPLGVISTIAGTGTAGFSGDGGLAIFADIGATNIYIDNIGNIYLPSDALGSCVRKINPQGIISTIVSATGTAGFSGDGGPATAALLYDPYDVTMDLLGNMYISDMYNNRIRKVTQSPSFSAATFSVYLNNLCSGVKIAIATKSFSTGMSVETLFGDGLQSNTPVSAGFGGGYVTISHTYNQSGTYTIKHVLMNGAIPIDSISYTNQYKFCNTLEAKFYYDANSNCSYNPGIDHDVFLPVTTEIDSNGINIGQVSTTSGLYYEAYGNPGDIYTMKVISRAPGLSTTCPASGIISDTLKDITYMQSNNNFGFNCSSTPGFDLLEYATLKAGPQTGRGQIIIQNTYCNRQTANVTMNISPKYKYRSAFPLPSSISGNTITWDVTGISSSSAPSLIHFTIDNASTADFMPGDTVNSNYTTNPISGDTNPSDNIINLVDTVQSSYDPNYMEVSPQLYIASGTELTYTIEFENTGNDTAHDIYVMDTLSHYLDATTLAIATASSSMNTEVLNTGNGSILKLDFPSIMLLDSSHHDECTGLVIFKIKTLPGLSDGTVILNSAGIYFDTNPAVGTNTVENIIGIPSGVPTVNNNVDVALYPNPANDELTISANKATYHSFTITNSIGQLLMQREITNTKTVTNISKLPAGIYFVSLKGDNGISTQKFIKISN